MEAEAVVLFWIGVAVVLIIEAVAGIILLKDNSKDIRKEFLRHWICELFMAYFGLILFNGSKGIFFDAVYINPSINLALIGFNWALGVYFVVSLILKIIDKK